MLITRKSQISGIERTLNIPCTEEQYNAYIAGQHIQYAMPNVSPQDREFILTGITSSEWGEVFPEDEELDYPPNKEDDHLPYKGAF
jgi:hypothetical protein